MLELLSSSPSREDRLPSAVWIELPEFTATFSIPPDIRALGEVLSSAMECSGKPDVKRHMRMRNKAGKLIVAPDGRDVAYNLYRSATDSSVWILELPDRSHPGASIIPFCDDGSFMEILHKYRNDRKDG